MKPIPPKADGSAMTWRERFAALKWLPPLFKMVWETNSMALRRHTGALRLVVALVPILSLIVAKRIINDVVAAIRHQTTNPNDVWYMIGAAFVLAVLADTLSRIISLVDSLLGDRFTHRLDVMISGSRIGARSLLLRGSSFLRQNGTGAPASTRPHGNARIGRQYGEADDHSIYNDARRRGLLTVASGSFGCIDDSSLHRGNQICVSKLLTPVPTNPSQTRTRLYPLPRSEPSKRKRGQDLRGPRRAFVRAVQRDFSNPSTRTTVA